MYLCMCDVCVCVYVYLYVFICINMHTYVWYWRIHSWFELWIILVALAAVIQTRWRRGATCRTRFDGCIINGRGESPNLYLYPLPTHFLYSFYIVFFLLLLLKLLSSFFFFVLLIRTYIFVLCTYIIRIYARMSLPHWPNNYYWVHFHFLFFRFFILFFSFTNR